MNVFLACSISLLLRVGNAQSTEPMCLCGPDSKCCDPRYEWNGASYVLKPEPMCMCGPDSKCCDPRYEWNGATYVMKPEPVCACGPDSKCCDPNYEWNGATYVLESCNNDHHLDEDGISGPYFGFSCENNFNLGAFDCITDCAEAALDTPQCSGTNRLMFDDYYSVNHASWGCRCCRDYDIQSHGIWEMYDYSELSTANNAPLIGTGTVDIVMNSKVALAALAVFVLLILNILLCFYRKCASEHGRNAAKPAIYGKVEMVSSVDEDAPMM